MFSILYFLFERRIHMTRLMVLGLLMQYGPMSGYELQQAMQSAQTDTWAGVFPASIYHALKKWIKKD